MSALGRGDWVEALFDAPDGCILKGYVLQIRVAYGPDPMLGDCADCHTDIGSLNFYGIDDALPGQLEGGWCPCGFKPADPPGKDVIADLMKLPAMQPRRRVCEPA